MFSDAETSNLKNLREQSEKQLNNVAFTWRRAKSVCVCVLWRMWEYGSVGISGRDASFHFIPTHSGRGPALSFLFFRSSFPIQSLVFPPADHERPESWPARGRSRVLPPFQKANESEGRSENERLSHGGKRSLSNKMFCRSSSAAEEFGALGSGCRTVNYAVGVHRTQITQANVRALHRRRGAGPGAPGRVGGSEPPGGPPRWSACGGQGAKGAGSGAPPAARLAVWLAAWLARSLAVRLAARLACRLIARLARWLPPWRPAQ